jgi:hypothetical protein
MNDMIVRAKAALLTYECVPERHWWRVVEVAKQTVVFQAKTWTLAKEECDVRNVRAVLKALHEPTEDMIIAGAMGIMNERLAQSGVPALDSLDILRPKVKEELMADMKASWQRTMEFLLSLI